MSLQNVCFENCEINQEQAEGIIEIFNSFPNIWTVNFIGNEFSDVKSIIKWARNFKVLMNKSEFIEEK